MLVDAVYSRMVHFLVPAWRVAAFQIAYEKIDENTFCMPDFSIALHVEFIILIWKSRSSENYHALPSGQKNKNR